MKIALVKGVEGDSLYLNDYRIAGPKPWGGGTVIKEWSVRGKDVATALSGHFCLTCGTEHGLTAACAGTGAAA